MEDKLFKITKIEGEYAYLTPEDDGEDIFISLALLPLGSDVGTRLVCHNFEFSEPEK